VYDKAEFPPLLPEGMHPLSVENLEELCVKRFPSSRTRQEIMRNFRTVLQRILQAGIGGEIWINGSFMTEKIDPADIDFFVNIPSHYYDSGTDEQVAVIDWLISRENEPKRMFLCDTDVCFIYPATSPDRYVSDQILGQWRRLFGFSAKTGEPKGIAIISLGEARP